MATDEGRNGSDPVSHDDAKATSLLHLTAEHRLAEAAVASRLDAMRMARGFGATWEEIGAAMGISRQTANKKYGREVDGGFDL